MFRALVTQEKPIYVRLQDGRQEVLPDLRLRVRAAIPSLVASYLLSGTGGALLGGLTGLYMGKISENRIISKHPESKKRIEEALLDIKADMVKKKVETLGDQKGEENTVE